MKIKTKLRSGYDSSAPTFGDGGGDGGGGGYIPPPPPPPPAGRCG